MFSNRLVYGAISASIALGCILSLAVATASAHGGGHNSGGGGAGPAGNASGGDGGQGGAGGGYLTVMVRLSNSPADGSTPFRVIGTPLTPSDGFPPVRVIGTPKTSGIKISQVPKIPLTPVRILPDNLPVKAPVKRFIAGFETRCGPTGSHTHFDPLTGRRIADETGAGSKVCRDLSASF